MARPPSERDLAELWNAPEREAELGMLLERESRLPGPRGNLELAARFADGAASGPTCAQWRLLARWLALGPNEAPVGSAREYLPFCAVLAAGAAWAKAVGHRPMIERHVRHAANDERWRLREGVAMALQRIGYSDAAALGRLLNGWLESATLLEQRAVVAALADPPLLRGDASLTRRALSFSESILASIASVEPAGRKAEPFRALEKGLSYALSVFVAQQPESGFELLGRWATKGDAVIRRIVACNLGKARLSKRFPRHVAQVRSLIEREERQR